MDYKDYYKILGVDKKATQAEIKKKFRKLAIQFHPDKNPDNPKAEQRFKEVNEAYEVLGDADKRKKYDELGANWKHYDQFKAQGSGRGRGRQYQYSGDFADFFGQSGGGFSDFFKTFFGGSGFGSTSNGFGRQSGFHVHRQPSSTTAKGELNLSFEEAFTGTSKTIQINGDKVRLAIKPGAKDGQKLKLSGKGHHGGDLILNLRVNPSKKYKLDGLNISSNIPVDLYTAVLGGKVEVESPKGKFLLSIPAGTSSGKRFRLKGKGMPKYGSPAESGDFIAEVKIEIPKQLSEKEIKLFEELRNIRKVKA